MAESGFFYAPSMRETWGAGTPERIGGSLTGWSEVWLVERDGKFRVLKSLKSNYRGLPLYEGLLKKEFEMGSSLSHGNICQTFAFIEHPALGNCIEMEWVDGRSLDKMKADCRKDPLLARKLILEICDALICIHSHQMVHQDLKPSNILVTHNGNNVKIIDFGLSLEDSQSEFRVAGGTKSYAAPELIEGKKADVLSDIYSLGKVIEQISPRYRRIVKRCCKHNPAERFMSVADVKEAVLNKDKAHSWVLPLAIAAAAAVIAVLMLLNRRGEGVYEALPENSNNLAAEVVEAVPVQASESEPSNKQEISGLEDKAKAVVQAKTEEKEKAAEPSKKIEEIEDETDLDDLFDSVTELFEEKEGGK